jgi:uncharacterized protein (DUF1800 family)
MPLDNERGRVSHLLRRAGFGAGEQELAEYVALGFDGAVDRLLHDAGQPDAPDLTTPEEVGLQLWWLERMLRTSRPLLEKMTLFWHGHLTSALRQVQNPSWLQAQNELLRSHALTESYADLLRAISRDPAMAAYLDLRTNRKQAPNENYARELMELFTLGIGSYSEDDVREAARAYTGWSVGFDGKFAFLPAQHDSGPKTVLGQSGPLNGDDVSVLLAARPETARFMSRKLFRFFAYPDPEPALVERLAGVYAGSGGSIRALVEAILRSPEFVSERAYRALVKSPVEVLVGTLRRLGAERVPPQLAAQARQLGQELFNPPNVAGWFGGRSWINASTLLGRFNAQAGIVNQLGGPVLGGPAASALFAGAGSPTERVERALALLVDGDALPEERAALLAFAGNARGDEQDRGLLRLTMALPAYQLS